jgi:hypothetical protein
MASTRSGRAGSGVVRTRLANSSTVRPRGLQYGEDYWNAEVPDRGPTTAGKRNQICCAGAIHARACRRSVRRGGHRSAEPDCDAGALEGATSSPDEATARAALDRQQPGAEASSVPPSSVVPPPGRPASRCMGPLKSSNLFHPFSTSSPSFIPASLFDLESRFFARPTRVGDRRAQELSRSVVALAWRHAQSFAGRALTAPSTAAHACASAAKLRGAGPILKAGIATMGESGTHHLEPSSRTHHAPSGRGSAPPAPSPLHRGGNYDPPAAAGDRIGSSDGGHRPRLRPPDGAPAD